MLWPQLKQWLVDKAEAEKQHYQLLQQVLRLPGTETCKNSWEGTLAVCQAINDHGIDRHSYVLAIGGGAFLDMVGFAAAIAHRGVRLIRVPTTVLAQADSGVGVKAAINAYGKKNFLGSFAVPAGVINDAAFLQTLDGANVQAGLAEALKVALIKDSTFWEVLENNALAAISHKGDALTQLVNKAAELHLTHIATSGDAFEQGSSRPLDFGHWSAHKLEAITNFSILHGHAVAFGIMLDITYSNLMGWLPNVEHDRIMALFRKLGYQQWHATLESQTNKEALLNGLEEFREHLGGKLTILMLEGIGKTKEVHEIDLKAMRQALDHLARA